MRLGGSRKAMPLLPLALSLSLMANLFFLFKWQPQPSDSPLADASVELAAKPDAPPVEAVPAEPTPAPAADPFATKQLSVIINGAVARAFAGALGTDDGNRLAVTAGRILVWWLDPTKDPRKGDRVDVLYRQSPDRSEEYVIEALRYKSDKFGKTFEAWRHQVDGQKFPTWYDGDGREIPGRLVGGPIAEYEQITALLGDGRGHKGMDFKAPVGTPITAPFAGKIKRVNWNTRYNGNSIEMGIDGGKTVRFLHLDKLAAGTTAGKSVAAGTVLADSGNTGRSFAPHLHYEVSDSRGRTLDPLNLHEVAHNRLQGPALEAYTTNRAALLASFDTAVDAAAEYAASIAPTEAVATEPADEGAEVPSDAAEGAAPTP